MRKINCALKYRVHNSHTNLHRQTLTHKYTHSSDSWWWHSLSLSLSLYCLRISRAEWGSEKEERGIQEMIKRGRVKEREVDEEVGEGKRRRGEEEGVRHGHTTTPGKHDTAYRCVCVCVCC